VEKADIALPGGSPSQSYVTSLAIWFMGSHTDTVLGYLPPDTVNTPQLTQAGTRFTYPGGMEG